MPSLNISVVIGALDKLIRPLNVARQSAGALTESISHTENAIGELDTQARAFNRLRESVRQTSHQIDDTGQQLAALQQLQRSGTRLNDAQRQRMVALAARLDTLKAARAQEISQLQNSAQALRRHGVSLAGGDRTIESAIRRTEQYNQTLARQRNQLNRVTQAQNRYERMQQRGEKLRSVGASALGHASNLASRGAQLLEPGMAFGKAMSRVQAATGLAGDSPQLAALRVQAKKLGATSTFGAADAARGQTFLAMAGFTPEAIEAALPGLMNQVALGEIDLDDAASISALTPGNSPQAAQQGAAAATLSDNLAGDLQRLSSAWAGLSIVIAENLDGPLRSLTQGLSKVINGVSGWMEANPALSSTLLTLGGGALALTAAIGGISMAAGLLTGPLAKMQLGLSLLTGIGGLGGMLRGLIGPMSSISGWSTLFSTLGAGVSGLAGHLASIGGALVSVFSAPGAALASLGQGIIGLISHLNFLPALWGMVTGAVSTLGGMLSLLLSPIGLIGVALVAAGLLIWKYWEPIKAFFAGFFSGLVEGLSPVFEAFSWLIPVFSLIGEGIQTLWQWFSELLTPVKSSKESLDKCTSAGQTFGKLVAEAIKNLLLPFRMFGAAVGRLLRNLKMIPENADNAAEKLAGKTTPLEKSALADKPEKPAVKPVAPVIKQEAPKPPQLTMPKSPVTGIKSPLGQRSASPAAAESPKRVGPGDIVFKNLPPALAVRDEWQEPKLVSRATSQTLSAHPAVIASTQPIRQAELPAVSRPSASAPAAPASFSGEVHVHLHGVDYQSAQELGRIAAEAVNAELARRERMSRSSFRDRE